MPDRVQARVRMSMGLTMALKPSGMQAAKSWKVMTLRTR